MARTRGVAHFATVISLITLLAVSPFGQHLSRAAFERAKMLDESNRNLTEAIRLYSQVVSEAKGDRTLAAWAQFRIGILYLRTEKRADAMSAFRTLVAQYPDQTDLAARARTKLAELAALTKATNEVFIRTERSPDDRRLLASYRLPVGYSFSRIAVDTAGRRLYTFATRIRPLTSDLESKRAVRRGLQDVYEPSTLVVMDLDTSSIVRTVPFRLFHGDVALNATTGLLYAPAIADGCVKVIDTRTLLEKASIRLEGFPSGVEVNPITNRVYATCQGFGGNDKLFVINADTNTVTARVDLEGIASNVVVNTATNRVYATVGEPPKIRVFDGQTSEATEDLPELRVFAADTLNNRIYAALTSAGGPPDELRVLDGTTHRTIANLFAGQYGIADVAIDADANLAYVCLNAQGQLTVVDTRTFTEVTREVLYGASLVAVDPQKQRLYLTHPAYQGGPTTVDVADARSFATRAPDEFSEDFDTETLSSEWTVFKGRGSASLSEATGRLRFKLQPRTVPEKQLVLARQFAGDRWTMEVRASYFAGTTGGVRNFSFRVAFGFPEMLGTPPPVASIRVDRKRGDWNGCCPGVVGVSLGSRGLSYGQYEAQINADDSYVWRVKRDRRDIVVERSDDGISFIEVATHRFGPEIDGVIQYFCITGNSHANKDAYADYEYVRLTRLHANDRE